MWQNILTWFFLIGGLGLIYVCITGAIQEKMGWDVWPKHWAIITLYGALGIWDLFLFTVRIIFRAGG